MGLLRWLRATYYIRISADRVCLRDVDGGHTLDAPAVVAIERSERRVQAVAVAQAAVEAAAKTPGLELVYPFRHARVPVGDFTVAEILLTDLVRQFVRGIRGWPRAGVRVLIHPLHDLEGGLTQIERRAFLELAHNCGARSVAVYEGRELADHEIDGALFKKLTV